MTPFLKDEEGESPLNFVFGQNVKITNTTNVPRIKQGKRRVARVDKSEYKR